jgi:archaellum biogenesis protein FlaJ (TadC family)
MNTKDEPNNIKKYWPLISLIIIAVLGALAINWPLQGGMKTGMHYFMGIFLLMFSTLKLFHPSDFADGFQMYDLLAKRSRLYAYLYPLIELFLGLAYLSFFLPLLTYLLTAVIMIFGSVGVIDALRRGLNINCPCMGTVLDVPLSTVTLTEDIGMAVMALLMFLSYFI